MPTFTSRHLSLLALLKAFLTNLLEDKREGEADLSPQPFPWNGTVFMVSLISSLNRPPSEWDEPPFPSNSSLGQDLSLMSILLKIPPLPPPDPERTGPCQQILKRDRIQIRCKEGAPNPL